MRHAVLERIARWDVRVGLALQQRRTKPRNFLAAALSWSGAGGVWFAMGAGLTVAQQHGVELLPRQPTFLAAMCGAFAVLLIGGVIKRVVRRPRPFTAAQGITAGIWAPGHERSFPSTHAATSCVLATALLVACHPLAPLVTAWAIGVSFSRVWLGAHYASDVLGGAVLGVVFGFFPWQVVLR